MFFGHTGKLDDLATSITKHKNEKFFVPLSDVHTDEIKNMLDGLKVQHSEAVMYRTVSNDFAEGEAFDYDMLVFFSPSGIASLMKNFPNFQQGDMVIASFGPTTAKAVRDANLRLDIEAPTVEAPSMAAAIELYLKKNR